MENKDNLNFWDLFIILFIPLIGILWFIYDVKKNKKKKKNQEEDTFI
jgi:cbb3-type cytochrome oxidase subunit 3